MAFTTITAALVGDLLILPALLAQFPGSENSIEGTAMQDELNREPASDTSLDTKTEDSQ